MGFVAQVLVVGVDGRWEAGIGDPTFLGWLTVLAYALVAWASFRASRASVRRAQAAAAAAPAAPAAAADERLLGWFWRAITATLVLLGINKQLDLQSWLIERVRDAAHAGGWYEDRRRYQLLFVALAVVIGAIVALALVRTLRGVAPRVAGAILGISVLGTFVVVRAASFHGIDLMLGGGSFGLDALLELGGIVLIGHSARGARASVQRRP